MTVGTVGALRTSAFPVGYPAALQPDAAYRSDPSAAAPNSTARLDHPLIDALLAAAATRRPSRRRDGLAQENNLE
jgi:hypothetical protein